MTESASHPAEFFNSPFTSQLIRGLCFFNDLIYLLVGTTPIFSRYRTAYSCSRTSINSFVKGASSN